MGTEMAKSVSGFINKQHSMEHKLEMIYSGVKIDPNNSVPESRFFFLPRVKEKKPSFSGSFRAGDLPNDMMHQKK